MASAVLPHSPAAIHPRALHVCRIKRPPQQSRSFPLCSTGLLLASAEAGVGRTGFGKQDGVLRSSFGKQDAVFRSHPSRMARWDMGRSGTCSSKPHSSLRVAAVSGFFKFQDAKAAASPSTSSAPLTPVPSAGASSAATTSGGLGESRFPAQFIELTCQEDFEDLLKEASEKGQLVLVEWMAQWCRKCIYLKPKIERLVFEYPSVKCCVVDVNKVPFSFVKHANISKMPTLQLWKKGAQVEDLIGGEAAFLVLDKTREMIKRHL